MTAEEQRAWLSFSLASLGAKRERHFLQALGKPPQVFSESEKSWHGRLLSAFGADEGLAVLKCIQNLPADTLENTLRWAEEPNNHLLINPCAGFTDEEKALAGDDVSQQGQYPRAFADLKDAPLVLYAKGDLDWLTSPAIAIVGARNSTAYGERLAEDFAEEFVRAGLVVVSGLAQGVDAAAHRGALRENGATIAVLGTGANIIYPPKNRSLAKSIAERGLILSEFPLDTPPRPQHFPRRNRLIAALSLGTVVVEANEKSGALITARMAGEIGREVFAIPGSVHSPLSRGPHRLLKEGAKLVENTGDVLVELQSQLIRYVHILEQQSNRSAPEPHPEHIANAMPPVKKTTIKSNFYEPINALAQSEPVINPSLQMVDHDSNNDSNATPALINAESLLAQIAYSPTLLDDIVARCGGTLAQVHGLLLELEMDGRVESMAGGRFQRLT